jgi:hypothetical protein
MLGGLLLLFYYHALLFGLLLALLNTTITSHYRYYINIYELRTTRSYKFVAFKTDLQHYFTITKHQMKGGLLIK